MALISVAVYDREGSGRTELTRRFLDNMIDTVEPIHRFFLIDNDSCLDTKRILHDFKRRYNGECTILENVENVGTAKAINQGWKCRKPGEACLKVDNDIIIHEENWIEKMEEVIKLDPSIGIVGLKRRDCVERPDHPNHDYKSTLMMLPHNPGQKWVIVERAKHVMGTCHLINPALIDTIGGYYQMNGLYGWDDFLYCVRAHLAGFKSVFLPQIDLDHLYEVDVSGASDEYAIWKQEYASKFLQSGEFVNTVREYESGERSLMTEL